MKLTSLLDSLAALPADSSAAPRRTALRQLGQAAAAALPLALGAAPAAQAAPADTAYDSLLQLLLLERLQAALYTQGLAVAGLIPAAVQADFQRLRSHQSQHVQFLVQALQTAGALVPATPSFDFSGRRNVATNPVLFPNVLSDYDQFLALAQQLEDLGVRLYKVQAVNITYDASLTLALLKMHAVEAQHSAHVRTLRRGRGAMVQPWPSDEDAPIVRTGDGLRLTAAATGGDETTVQYSALNTTVPFGSLLLIRDNTAVHDPSLAEAFDEPVTPSSSATSPQATAQAALDLFS